MEKLEKNKELDLYSQFLFFRKKEELRELAGSFGVKWQKSWKRELLAKAIESYILENPDCLIDMLPERNLKLLRTFVHAGGSLPFTTEWEKEDYGLLDEYNLVASTDLVDGSHYAFIPNNLRDSLKDRIDRIVNDSRVAVWSRRDMLIKGLIRLYGILPAGELLELYNSFSGEIPVTLAELQSIISCRKKIIDEVEEETIEDVHYYYSAFVYDLDYLLSCIRQRDKISRKDFSKEEMAAFAENGFIFALRERNALADFLSKKKLTQEITEWLLADIWKTVQNDYELEQIITSLLGMIRIKNDREIMDLCELMKDYVNLLPRWILKGHSAEETFSIVEKLEMESRFGGVVKRNLTHQVEVSFSTSRNDPCPCGSGKKYKKCCGRMN